MREAIPSSPSKRFAPPRFETAPAPPGSEAWQSPWVQLKYISYRPTIYPAMLRAVSADAKPGDLVTVYNKEGQRFGAGLYNPSARVPLRVFHYGDAAFGEDGFAELIERAVDLRVKTLNLPERTDAFRVIHSEGDGLSGFVVDKYANVLSVEVHSLGVYQRLPVWLCQLHGQLGTEREVINVEDRAVRLENIQLKDAEDESPRSTTIEENGVRFEVSFTEGHKTGFFCDQRENRLRLSKRVKNLRVLDLCCYTGGFSLSAALGGAKEVTGVDLDDRAIALAKRNENLNDVRVNWVHSDAFSYGRHRHRNGENWDVVVLDPPKFVREREDVEGKKHYEDLNGLAMNLLRPGGLLLTCSCSGLVSCEEFEQLVIRTAHRQQRTLQILDRTGAGADHPTMSNCPESRYLKVLWAKVL